MTDAERGGVVRARDQSHERALFNSARTGENYAVTTLGPGSRVAGKYVLVRLIGKGGMGAVYEAEHAFTARHVALKVLHPETASRPGFAERFLREAQAASRIGHAGIVDVLDAGVDPADGTLYLALELLDGEDLAAAVARGAVDPPRLLRIALELCVALDAAHGRSIVHRDIKPENVFLTRDGRTKLLDFGIAKQVSADEGLHLTATGAVLGTPYYMSPEQARGLEVDARTDLWSLGAVLYHALSGRPPFAGSTYNALLAAILTEPVASLGTLRPDLPAAVVAIVDRALARDRDARWPSARAMGEAIESVLAGRALALPVAPPGPTHVVPPNAPTRTEVVRPARGGPSFTTIAVLCIVLGVLGVGGYYVWMVVRHVVAAVDETAANASHAVHQLEQTGTTVEHGVAEAAAAAAARQAQLAAAQAEEAARVQRERAERERAERAARGADGGPPRHHRGHAP